LVVDDLGTVDLEADGLAGAAADVTQDLVDGPVYCL
jgi:hypothetical protein